MKTVTIGIPAHNEAANIGYLLKSIGSQRGNNFIIKTIVVLCDGCTDKTATVARAHQPQGIKTIIIKGKKRLGKMARLNQMYAMNRSDILITIDADTVLGKGHAIKRIIKAFDDPAVVLAVFHQEPIKSESFIGEICRAADLIWTESRIHVNNGDHVRNLLGSASAMRQIITQKVRYPSELNADCTYLYVSAKKFGEFKYVYDAKVFYRAPDTLYDFWSIASRAIFYMHRPTLEYLGSSLNNIHKIPLSYKIRGTVAAFLRIPLYTTLAIGLNILVRLFPRRDRKVRSKTWEMAPSARKAIAV